MKTSTIIIIVAGIILGIIAVLALGYFGVAPFKSIYQPVEVAVKGVNVKDLTNPTTIATTTTTAGVGIAGAATLASKLKSAKAQASQAESAVKAAQEQAGTLGTEIEGKTTELEAANQNLTNAKTTIAEQQKTLEAQTAELNTTKEMYGKALDDLKLKPQVVEKVVTK